MALSHYEKNALKRARRNDKSKPYPLEASPLWNLKSLHGLLRLLEVTHEQLLGISTAPHYRHGTDIRRSKKLRTVDEPKEETWRLQQRLFRLLDRIERPPFVHSATRGRSYVSNAREHLQGGDIICTDIRKFYQSTSYSHVRRFFFKDMKMAHDLASLLAKLCTVNGHLPLGSSFSPLLSYMVHRRMFADIEKLCRAQGARFTLYVDDLTMSGTHNNATLLPQIRRRIHQENLTTHDDKFFPEDQPAVVTGVAIHNQIVGIPQGLRKEIEDMMQSSGELSIKEMARLRGKIAAAGSIDPTTAETWLTHLRRIPNDGLPTTMPVAA